METAAVRHIALSDILNHQGRPPHANDCIIAYSPIS